MVLGPLELPSISCDELFRTINTTIVRCAVRNRAGTAWLTMVDMSRCLVRRHEVGREKGNVGDKSVIWLVLCPLLSLSLTTLP